MFRFRAQFPLEIQLERGRRILSDRNETGLNRDNIPPSDSWEKFLVTRIYTIMSELTFNIADYRPLTRARTHGSGSEVQGRSGFVVLSSNSEPRQYEQKWADSEPVVVDICSVRESHRTNPRRGKILRFCKPASHRLYTMPVHPIALSTDDDPGPMVA
jgi:hypothetical protein